MPEPPSCSAAVKRHVSFASAAFHGPGVIFPLAVVPLGLVSLIAARAEGGRHDRRAGPGAIALRASAAGGGLTGHRASAAAVARTATIFSLVLGPGLSHLGIRQLRRGRDNAGPLWRKRCEGSSAPAASASGRVSPSTTASSCCPRSPTAPPCGAPQVGSTDR